MDTSTVISIAALVVSALALPTSYFVATKQVRLGLDEYERRRKLKAFKQAADQLDEFVSLFFSAASVYAGFDVKSEKSWSKLNSKIAKIDAEVEKTGALDRVAKSLDELLDSGALGESREVENRVRAARVAISQGSLEPSRWATLRLCEICNGNELARLLREQL
jgi:hypothetical protein